MQDILINIKIDNQGKIISTQAVTQDFIKSLFQQQKNNITQQNNKILLTNEEAAKILGTTKDRIIELRSRGIFPTYTYTKIDGLGYRFYKDKLIEFIKKK